MVVTVLADFLYVEECCVCVCIDDFLDTMMALLFVYQAIVGMIGLLDICRPRSIMLIIIRLIIFRSHLWQNGYGSTRLCTS